jgi:hypothetical protein
MSETYDLWVDGKLTVTPYTAEELVVVEKERKEWQDGAFNRAIEELRTKRNRLLAKTDWTANSDVTMSDAMKTYRQQLRDAPSGLDTVEKVNAYTFPTEVTK